MTVESWQSCAGVQFGTGKELSLFWVSAASKPLGASELEPSNVNASRNVISLPSIARLYTPSDLLLPFLTRIIPYHPPQTHQKHVSRRLMSQSGSRSCKLTRSFRSLNSNATAQSDIYNNDSVRVQPSSEQGATYACSP